MIASADAGVGRSTLGAAAAGPSARGTPAGALGAAGGVLRSGGAAAGPSAGGTRGGSLGSAGSFIVSGWPRALGSAGGEPVGLDQVVGGVDVPAQAQLALDAQREPDPVGFGLVALERPGTIREP